MSNKDYETESRSRWGDTPAYREHQKKPKTTQKKNGKKPTKT
jgi:hypothetical protein